MYSTISTVLLYTRIASESLSLSVCIFIHTRVSRPANILGSTVKKRRDKKREKEEDEEEGETKLDGREAAILLAGRRTLDGFAKQ